MTIGHERALRIFRAAPGQLMTANHVAEAMVSQGHDFGTPGRTALARAALVTAILTRLATSERGQLAAGPPLGTEPRWYLPTHASEDRSPSPPTPPAASLVTSMPAAAVPGVDTVAPAVGAWRASWRSLTPRDRFLATLTIVLSLVVVTLLVVAVT